LELEVVNETPKSGDLLIGSSGDLKPQDRPIIGWPDHPMLYPAFSIIVSETLRFSTISRVTSNSFTFFWLG